MIINVFVAVLLWYECGWRVVLVQEDSSQVIHQGLSMVAFKQSLRNYKEQPALDQDKRCYLQWEKERAFFRHGPAGLLFFHLFVQFMIPSPRGRGVNSHVKRLGLLDILLKFCISRILVLLTVFKTTHDHFQLSKYLLGCTRRKNNKRSARISVFTLEFLRSLESSLSLNARAQSFPEQRFGIVLRGIFYSLIQIFDEHIRLFHVVVPLGLPYGTISDQSHEFCDVN